MTASDITWELSPAPWPSAPQPIPEWPEDDALAAIARSEQYQINRGVDLTLERDGYRQLSVQLLEALHSVTLERDLLREQRRLDSQRARAAA